MSEEFSAGVKILLQRMETHPEEFFVRELSVGRDPKWHSVMTSVMQVRDKENPRGAAAYLTDAEVDALWEGYRKIRRKAFDDHVMGSVLNPEELSSSEDMISKMQGQMGQPKIRLQGSSNNINEMQQYSGYANMQGIGGAGGVDTNQYRNTSQSQAEHIAAHQRALSAAAMDEYPYPSSQKRNPQPMSESMLSRINKRLGFK
jgi:hypothetical protein